MKQNKQTPKHKPKTALQQQQQKTPHKKQTKHHHHQKIQINLMFYKSKQVNFM